MEYALGTDPNTASAAGLPVVDIQSVSGTNYQAISFTRPFSNTDITYYVLKMMSWTGLIWDLRPVPKAAYTELGLKPNTGH